MALEVSYSMVMNVSSSWDSIKMTSDFEMEMGSLIFTKLFTVAPEAKSLFGFSVNEDIQTNPKFVLHVRTVVDMIDCAVAFLGPDLEPLEEHLVDLGARHVNYGVKAEYLSIMGRSVIYALQELLGNRFTSEDAKDWTMVFEFIISKMALGMKA